MVVYPDFKIDEAGGLVLVQIEPHAHRHISVLEILASHTQSSFPNTYCLYLLQFSISVMISQNPATFK